MGGVVSQFINDFWPVPVIHEMIRIFPDALFWGIGILGLVTLSFSYSVLFGSLIEALGIYHIIKAVNNSIGIVDAKRGSTDRSCRTGFTGTSLQTVSVFDEPSQIPFPSSHIFMLSFISSYILSMIVAFRDEFNILGDTYGESYVNRIYYSVCAFAIMMFVSMSYRLFYSCDSFIVISMSFIIGVTAGAIVVQQNKALLGIESLNLLGVPILRKRTAAGNELLVCSSSTT